MTKGNHKVPKQLIVLPVSTKVLIGGVIEAEIMGIGIYSKNYVKYQCVWWNGNVRVDEWVEQKEVKAIKKSKNITIGFADPQCI